MDTGYLFAVAEQVHDVVDPPLDNGTRQLIIGLLKSKRSLEVDVKGRNLGV